METEVDSEEVIEADIEEIVKVATEEETVKAGIEAEMTEEIEEENRDLETAITVGKVVILLEIAPIVILVRYISAKAKRGKRRIQRRQQRLQEWR